MYAVVKTGGKQYKVSPGTILEVEKLIGEVGANVVLDEVLLVSDEKGLEIGRPQVSGASVKAKIVQHFRGDKKIIFKKLRRHDSRLKKGHRQNLTRIEIEEIAR
ncbi:UNVERIFIED_CONTAM: hypothetical protein GTU68_022286 [Idotea baltica]|nr:hypothetical protein [Idotea baltica]